MGMYLHAYVYIFLCTYTYDIYGCVRVYKHVCKCTHNTTTSIHIRIYTNIHTYYVDTYTMSILICYRTIGRLRAHVWSTLYIVEVFFLLGCKLGIQAKLREVNYGIQGSPNLVWHICKELRLRSVRIIRCILGLLELSFDPPPLFNFLRKPIVSTGKVQCSLFNLVFGEGCHNIYIFTNMIKILN